VRTSDVAARAQVNPQTLRYYERIGLLPEPPRTAGGYRDYPEQAVGVLRFVRRAKELGFQLSEIEELLGFEDGDERSCAAARAVADRRIDDLEQRILDLSRMRDALTGAAADCGEDGRRPGHAHPCPILQALDDRD
jgi:MerR family transcriptional regulator, mercuric resistance operon regulatory protein